MNSDGVLVDMFPLAAANILTVVFKVRPDLVALCTHASHAI